MTTVPVDAPTWNLYGTLTNAARQPLVAVPVVVYPPADQYDDAHTRVINDVGADVTNDDGYFSINIASVPGIVWLVGVGTDEPVTIPDPGVGASVNIDSLMPAYVPNWQGGKRVAQGAGIASLHTSGSTLIATLTSGAVLPPVPFYSGQTLDADSGVRAFLPFSEQHDAGTAMRVLVLGGADAEGAGADLPADRWQNVLTDSLRSSYGGPTGDQGIGYIPAQYADQSMAASPWQPQFSGVVVPTDTSGPGNRSVVLGPDAGTSSEITWAAQPCNSITVHYATDATAKGSFQVWVDGTQVATLSCDPGVGAPDPAKTWVWNGSQGSHTLRLVWDSTNAFGAAVQGAFFATSATGVQVYDGSRGGDTPMNLFEIVGNTATTALLGALQPHLVVLAFGRQEMATSTASAWDGALRGLLTTIASTCPNTGVLVVQDPMSPADATGSAGNVPSSILTAFEDASRNAVVDHPNSSMISLSRLWQPRPGSTAAAQDPWNWLDYTTGDFSETAHLLVGRYIARLFQQVLAGGMVTSVAGRTGNIVLTTSDITATDGGFNPSVLASGTPETGKYVDGSGAWTPLPSISALSQQRGLVPMKEALDLGTVRIAVVGDGKAEGGGTSDIANRWQNTMAVALRDQMFSSPNADQGAGYLPVWNTVLKSEAAFGAGATWSGVEDTDYHLIGNKGGFGARSAQMLTVGATVTFPSSNVRYLTVCYTLDTATGGSFNVLVDGQNVATIDTTVIPTSGGDTQPVNPIGRQVIDLESVDTRTVAFTSIAGTPTVEGALLTTSTTGLTVVDAASSNFALVSDSIVPGSADDMTANALATASLSMFDPHLIVLATGTAEQSFADDSTWKASLGSYLGTLTTACPNAGILLLHGAARPEDARTAGVGLDRCTTYESSSQVIVGQAQFASMVRESTLWQPNSSQVISPENPTEQDPGHWLSGNFYPSDTGHARIAEHLVQTLVPGSGTATSANTLTVSMLDAALASDMSNAASASRTLLDQTYQRQDQRTGLIPWIAAYAARTGGLASIAVLSDYEGVGAASPTYANKWQTLLREALSGKTLAGPVVPAYSTASGLAPTATLAGSPVPTVAVEGTGFGGKVTRIATGGTVTFPTANCTGFRVWYRSDSTRAGSVSVTEDSTVVGTISAASPTETGRWPVTGPQPVASGSHTIKITGTAGLFDLAAVEFFSGDESVGVHLYDHSQQGLTLANATSASYVSGMWAMLAASAPSLLVVMIGADDFGGTNPNFGGSLSALATTVSQLLPNTSVLLVAPPRPVKAGADPTQWDSFVAAMKGLVALDSTRYAFVDLQETWPVLAVGGATSLGLMVESDYPFNFSPVGHQAIADALLRVLR